MTSDTPKEVIERAARALQDAFGCASHMADEGGEAEDIAWSGVQAKCFTALADLRSLQERAVEGHAIHSPAFKNPWMVGPNETPGVSRPALLIVSPPTTSEPEHE